MSGNLDVLQALLEAGASPHVCDLSGSFSLMEGSYNGHTDVVGLLLEKGADPNQKRADDGSAALHEAALKGRRAIVASLLRYGADPWSIKVRWRAPLSQPRPLSTLSMY